MLDGERYDETLRIMKENSTKMEIFLNLRWKLKLLNQNILKMKFDDSQFLLSFK